MRAMALGFVFLVTTVLPALAVADAIGPPPATCPPGYTPQSDHGGEYCQPPLPTDCPPDHVPRVRRENAYCEPPPDEPCPVGSFWRSRSATNTWCQGATRCHDRSCGPSSTCRESSLCVTAGSDRWGYDWGNEIVSGVCETDADCAGEYERCVRAQRCDPNEKRGAGNKVSGLPKPIAWLPGLLVVFLVLHRFWGLGVGD